MFCAWWSSSGLSASPHSWVVWLSFPPFTLSYHLYSTLLALHKSYCHRCQYYHIRHRWKLPPHQSIVRLWSSHFSRISRFYELEDLSKFEDLDRRVFFYQITNELIFLFDARLTGCGYLFLAASTHSFAQFTPLLNFFCKEPPARDLFHSETKHRLLILT